MLRYRFAAVPELPEERKLLVVPGERSERSVELLLEHLRGARGDVGDLADQIGVYALDEVGQVHVHVVRRRPELCRVVVPERLGRQMVEIRPRVDERALRLRHLLAVHREEAVHEDLVGLLEPRDVEHPRPEQAVEADDVLADEVVALGLRVLPPVLELLAVPLAPVAERGEVADRRVDPDVEELAGVPGDLEAEVRRVARNAPAAQGLPEPLEELVRDVARRVRGDPLLEVRVLGLELEVEVLRVPDDGRGAAGRALRASELLGAVGRAAVVAAVAVLVRRAALRADALHEAVGEEHPAVLAVELRRRLPRYAARLLHRREDLLGERLVLGRVRRVVVVERDLEVGEVPEVDRVRARDELLGRDALPARADHHRRAVRVVRADVDAVVAAHLLEADPEVGLDVLHQMAQVDVPVRVGERTRNDYLSLFGHSSPKSTRIL